MTYNANNLERHKLSSTSLNEAMLRSQERSKCDVSSELSQVLVLSIRKEGFPGIYGKQNAQTPSRTMTSSRHPLRSEPIGARTLVLRSYTAGGR